MKARDRLCRSMPSTSHCAKNQQACAQYVNRGHCAERMCAEKMPQLRSRQTAKSQSSEQRELEITHHPCTQRMVSVRNICELRTKRWRDGSGAQAFDSSRRE